MSQIAHSDMFLALPHQRPTIQREYTASPPTRHACTPNTSHGFIPLRTATPLPTAAAEKTSTSAFDYFSPPKKEACISPDAGGYEPHGFIPLCSVADVEKEVEASDYFSHLGHQQTDQVSASKSNSTLTPTSTSSNSKRDSSPPSPLRIAFTDQAKFSNVPMMHPTGSPVHERMTHMHLSLRGGGIYDPCEEAGEAERRKDELFLNKISSLEDVVSVHGAQADASIKPIRSEGVTKSKEETNKNRESWEEEWLPIAEALELPLSEVSDKDGDDNVLIEIRAEETSSQASGNNNARDGPSLAAPVVTDNQPPVRSSSLGTDIPMPPMPEQPSENTFKFETSSLVPPTKFLTQNIPPANLLTVPRPPRRPPLEKRHSSPVPSAAAAETNSKQSIPSGEPLSVPRPPARPATRKRQSPSIPPNLTIMKTAMYTDPRYLASLTHGPTVSVTSGSPPRILIPSIPLSMLTHFCPPTTLSSLRTADSSSLTLPTSCTKSSLSRILRFMTRCCLPHSHSSNSELPIPTNDLSAGIETVLACSALGLHADAHRLTSLILSTQLTTPLSPSTIDMLWTCYSSALRSTALGDLVVWFVLRESWKNEHGRAEEMLWMLEQPEFAELKERVRGEVGLRMWRKESKEEFLARWERERERVKRRRENKEMVERERVRRVEEIRKRNREVKERERGAGEKAWRVLDLDADKALPMTPKTPEVRFDGEMGGVTDGEDERDSTAAMYAEYARSFRAAEKEPPRQEVGMQKTGERRMSNNSIRVEPKRPVPVVQSGARPPLPSRTWEISRAAPVPRKKLSLWEKVKI